MGDACDSDDDNDSFSDAEERRIYGVGPGSAQERTPCRTATVVDPWPPDITGSRPPDPPGTPDRVVDTTEVSTMLGFVGLAPASPGYSVRLDLAADPPNNVIDSTEVAFILGFVGLSCTSPP